jgi:hypothetical protein
MGKLRDWASQHERNPTYVTTQLAYIDYALRNTHEQIGRDLGRGLHPKWRVE